MTAIAAFAAIGFFLGVAHFAALRWTVARYLAGARSAIGWYVARIVVTGGVLFALAVTGGPLLLAALAGFVVARFLAVRRAPREGPVS